MKHFLRRAKRFVHTRIARNRARKFRPIDIQDRDAPSLGLLILLTQLMSEGKYRKFLLAFSPRLRAEILRQERELLNHEPVLPQWEPNQKHLATERKKKEAADEE